MLRAQTKYIPEKTVATGAAYVAEHARHVRILYEKIPSYVEFILQRYPLVNALDSDLHLHTNDPETAARYVLALDSVNFGSGYFHFLPGFEYQSLSKGLKDAFARNEMATPSQWREASSEFFLRLLNIPQNAPPPLVQLCALYAEHLRATGAIMAAYQDKALYLIDKAQNSAAMLADTVGRWPHFRDEAAYRGRIIPFYKRAQILAADMNLALGGKLSDLEQLTIFADNMVPHVLRHDGILDYSATLAAQVDAGTLIEAGSGEEIEIRACAIHAVERMRDAAQTASHRVTAVNLDHLLWARGYEPDIYAKPSHRTHTTAY